MIALICSIQNESMIKKIFEDHKIQTIYHAAAYKHVPLIENNIVEGIFNNVFGTSTLLKNAINKYTETFILISTDKAVRPTNIMGASKRVAELICQSYANQKHSTLISIVRFGNVLGSSGSVVPKFQNQIKKGGPVTVTHKDICRYFMTRRSCSACNSSWRIRKRWGSIYSRHG